MSISAFQDKVFKSGCGHGIMIFAAIGVVAGMTYMGRCNNPNANNPEEENRKVEVTVGNVPLYNDEVESAVQRMEQQQQPGQTLGPQDELGVVSQLIDMDKDTAAKVVLVGAVGADTSDKALLQAFEQAWQKQITEARMRLVSQNKLKMDATDQEFEKQFKALSGQTPDQAKATTLVSVKKQMADKEQRVRVIAELADILAQDAIKSKINPSEAELKANYDSYTYKRILISSTGKKPEDAKAQAAKALAEVRAGGSFEQAMDRYSNDAPPAGKKVSEESKTIPYPEISNDPSLAALKSLKPGQVSEVIDAPEGEVIYKLISVKSNAPAGFDKNIKTFRAQYIEQQAQNQYQTQLSSIQNSSSLLKWTSQALKAAYDYQQLKFHPSGGGDMSSQYRAIGEAANKASQDGIPGDDRWAALTFYAAIDDAWNMAKDKAPLYEDRRASLEGLLKFEESFDARMQLVNLDTLQKNAEQTASDLISAANSNNDYTATGQKNWADVAAKEIELQKSGLLNAAASKAIDDAQGKWRQAKLDNDKQEAQEKIEQAAEQKKLAAQQAKQEAADKAMKEKTLKEEAAKAASPKLKLTAPPAGGTTGTPSTAATTGPMGPPPVKPGSRG